MLLLPSKGGRTFDGTLEPCEEMLTSELQKTLERYYKNSQNVTHTVVPQVQAESMVASMESQPCRLSPEVDTNTEDKTSISDEAALSAATALGHLFDQNEALAHPSLQQKASQWHPQTSPPALWKVKLQLIHATTPDKTVKSNPTMDRLCGAAPVEARTETVGAKDGGHS